MNISITPQQEKLIENKVKSGSYLSASEVVRTALRLLEEQDHIQKMRLETLNREIKKGFDSGKATPFDLQDTIKRGRERLAKNTNTTKRSF